MLVARGKGEVKSATGRERSQIDKATDILAAEITRLGIDARIVRPCLQVPAAKFDTQASRTAEESPGECFGQLVGKRKLTQLDERTIEHVLRDAVTVIPLRPQQSSVGQVR